MLMFSFYSHPTATAAAFTAASTLTTNFCCITIRSISYPGWGARSPGRGAFTRVLHRGTDDELMVEVPTQRFDPAHLNCDTYCSFPVADRAPALLAWATTPDARRCSHLLLVETDYVFVRPLPESALPPPGRALAFPFSYIIPSYPSVAPYAAKFYSGPVGDIPPTGNAPVLLGLAEFGRIAPEWARIVALIEADPVAVERLGWVRDMYAVRVHARKGVAIARRRCEHPPLSLTFLTVVVRGRGHGRGARPGAAAEECADGAAAERHGAGGRVHPALHVGAGHL